MGCNGIILCGEEKGREGSEERDENKAHAMMEIIDCDNKKLRRRRSIEEDSLFESM